MRHTLFGLGLITVVAGCSTTFGGKQSADNHTNTNTNANSDTQGGAVSLRSATFAVSWYDVGKRALDGLPGVRSVTTGWRGLNEVNEVRYDASQVNISTMEQALRQAGTYIKTFDK